MFRFFLENKLITPHQSGFKLGETCINQLLSINHEIYHINHENFDDGLRVRSVFLDISKAFDKIWQDVVIFKLEQNDISDDLLNLLIDFLSNRKQRVELNDQVSAWASVNVGVP